MRKPEKKQSVAKTNKSLLPGCVLLVCLLAVWCGTSFSIPVSQWINLPSDSNDAMRSIIQSEVNKYGFSTPQEDVANSRVAEDEKTRAEAENSKASYEADAEFKSARSRRDTLTNQFQRKAAEVEEAEKNIKNIRNTIENFNSAILRYESDIKQQQESMKKRMKEMKQGEVVVATIYNIGFKDKKHDREKLADMVSSPLMSEYMGVYIKSFTEVVNNAVIVDYIKSISNGTQRWISENPLTFMLSSNNQGTTFLRIKRYELYPFQEWLDKTKGVASSEVVKAAIITSPEDVRRFVSTEGYTATESDIAKVVAALQETNRRNNQSKIDSDDQINGFQESVRSLESKIESTKADRESQKGILDRKLKDFEKLNAEFQTARAAKESAEQLLEAKHLRVQQVNSVRETIIIQPAFAAIRGEQTAADACAETIIDKLNQVRNNARVQHSSSSTTVINSQYVAGTDVQEFKEA